MLYNGLMAMPDIFVNPPILVRLQGQFLEDPVDARLADGQLLIRDGDAGVGKLPDEALIDQGNIADGFLVQRIGDELVGVDPDDVEGGGAVPTGTGFRHIASGIEDAAAKLVDTADVNNDQINNAKLADMAPDRIKGRITASTGDPEDLTPAQVRTIINVADGANLYVHPNHTGEVTSVGDGAQTIAANVVTFAKLVDIASDRLIGRDTVGTGDPEALTVGGGVEFSGAGGIQRSQLTGDIGAAAGSNATALGADVVTNAKAANMAVNTIKGRITSGTGDPEDLTAANVRTIINVADGANNYVHPNHTGDVTSIGDGATAFRLGVAASVLGNPSGEESAPIVDIPAVLPLTILATNASFNIVWTPIKPEYLQFNTGPMLLGRDAAGAGEAQELTVGGGIEFTGALGVQRSALTGDVTAPAGSNTTTISDEAVTNAKLRDSVARSVIGRSGTTTGVPADIVAGSDSHFLSRHSGTLAFAAIVAADLPAASQLPVIDTTALVKGSVDPTKLARIEVDGFTTGVTRVLTPLNKDYTLEEVGHATKHNNGGADEISVAGLSGLLADGQTPLAHKTSHQNGGTDEISVVGLSGLLADGQTPLAHAASHVSGGSDAIKLDDLAAPDDNTNLNASTTKHGLLKKLDNVVTNFLDGTGAWSVPASAGGPPTGPAGGDLTGTYPDPDIAAGAVTLAQMANIATDRLIGRDTAATGVPEALTVENGLGFTGAGGIGIVADGVTNAMLRNSAALSVIGRSANSIANPADIAAVAASGAVLRESGSVIGFGTIATAGVANNAIDNTKSADMAEDTIKGRITTGTGDPEDLTPAQVRTMINVADGANNYVHPNHSGDVTSVADGAQTIAAAAVTLAKMANIATDRLIGRDTAATGVPEALTVGGGLGFTGAGGIEVANDGATNAKLANMAQNTIKGRITASTGDPEDLTAANVRTIINVADGANNYVHPNHTGDVTSIADGAQTIAAAAVTLAKMANIATDRLIGRDTAATGVPEALTVGGGLEFTGSGGIQRSALTSDVTASAGNGVTTIAANAVTNTKLADRTALSLMGRSPNTGGDPADIVATADGQFMSCQGSALVFAAITAADLPAGMVPTDVQVFTAAGAGTWTKPTGASAVQVILRGGGGGGGGGEGGAAASHRQGGSGGGGGSYATRTLQASELAATELISVGAAGTGGSGGSSAAGSNGGFGGTSSFGTNLVLAFGGGGGVGGPTTSSATSGGSGGGTAGAGQVGNVSTDTTGGAPTSVAGTVGIGGGGGGGNRTLDYSGRSAENGGAGGGGSDVNSINNPGPGGSSINGGGGGSGGAGVTTANVAGAGNQGGQGGTWNVAGGGTGGSSGGGVGGAGGGVGNSIKGGNGGGGGGSNAAGTGGAGGAGGIGGGGGGGGGAGTTIGGAGGIGGRGWIMVISW